MIFRASVLSDGTRLLTQSDFMTGMGMYYSGWIAKNKAKDDAADLPHFLAFESLKPFIEKHLGDLQSIVVKYRTEKGAVAHGQRATLTYERDALDTQIPKADRAVPGNNRAAGFTHLWTQKSKDYLRTSNPG